MSDSEHLDNNQAEPDMKRATLNICCVLLCMWLPISASAQPSAESVSAEELLAAVKHVMVDAALDESVNVVSSAFIDSNGQLIESSYFDATTNVRGVRMLEYLPQVEPVSAPEALLPESLRGVRNGVCAIRANAAFVPTLLVSAEVSLGHGRINDTMAEAIKGAMQGVLASSIAGHGQWVVVQEDERAARLSEYERVMIGVQRFEQAQYELRWRATTQPYGTGMTTAQRVISQGRDHASAAARQLLARNPVIPANFNARAQPVAVQFIVELLDRRTGEVIQAMRANVNLGADAVGLIADAEQPVKLTAALAPQMDNFFATFAKEQRCRLNQFPIVATGSFDGSNDITDFQIMLGEANRAALGDRFLLTPTPWQGGQQVFNSTLVGALSIAEIVQLDRHHAVVRIIAGNGTPEALNYAVPF